MCVCSSMMLVQTISDRIAHALSYIDRLDKSTRQYIARSIAY